jgi:hypothetical protein
VSEPKYPERFCNGGRRASAWCGELATVVCTDKIGLQWFTCDAHKSDAVTPIAEWFAKLQGMSNAEIADLLQREQERLRTAMLRGVFGGNVRELANDLEQLEREDKR